MGGAGPILDGKAFDPIKMPGVIRDKCALPQTWFLAKVRERQVMAQPVARRVLVSPLIKKDFRVCHPDSLVAILLQPP